MPTLTDLPQHIFFFAAILATLAISFVLFFFLPSLLVSFRLGKVIRQVKALDGKADMSALRGIFENSGVLEHLWREYADTLHKQADIDPKTGLPGAVRYRSTNPAGLMFSPEVIVDTPLRADFFKHLPGLFTGVGIIGTFYGLLLGLQAFEVSENPIIVRSSLNKLLHGVWEAFLVSASAISLAMIITFLEKLVITHLNAKVEELVQLLDSLFESGAGEEYLARLVRATEASSGQTAGLIKEDMKQILNQLVEKQITITQASYAALGDRITNSLEAGLKTPLNDIANALKNVRNDQNDAVQSMLSSALNQFSQQMKEVFGSQTAGINSMQQQTIEALQSAIATLQQTSSNLESAGLRSTSAIADQLAEALAGAEARQRVMQEKMNEFVEQVRQTIASTQGESQQQLQQSLNNLSDRMGVIIEELGNQVRSAAANSKQHHEDLAARSQSVIGQFGGQIEAIVEGVNRAVVEMKTAVQAMRDTTGDALGKLNSGADTLYLAAKDFAKAGNGVTATLDKSTAVANQLTQAASSVAAASNGLGGMLADYQSSRDAMVELVGSLQIIVEQARREASMTNDVLARIEAATGKLVEAQQQADLYLGKVSEVIGEAHESFSEGLTKAVGEANRDFHQALSDSVKLLREGIQELEDTLGSVSSH